MYTFGAFTMHVALFGQAFRIYQLHVTLITDIIFLGLMLWQEIVCTRCLLPITSHPWNYFSGGLAKQPMEFSHV